MIGGIVKEVLETEQHIWVNCSDTLYPNETCAVFVEKSDKARSISTGDKFWWQAGTCYWTPWPQQTAPKKPGIDYDIQIKKIGFSHHSRPKEIQAVLSH